MALIQPIVERYLATQSLDAQGAATLKMTQGNGAPRESSLAAVRNTAMTSIRKSLRLES